MDWAVDERESEYGAWNQGRLRALSYLAESCLAGPAMAAAGRVEFVLEAGYALARPAPVE